MRNEFWLVAAAGHCGTMWLSQVIGAQVGWSAHHELRYELSQQAWENAVSNSPQQVYWDQIGEELINYHVLDSNSWAPHEIPMVNKVVPVSRIIYLVRNGIQQIHSLATQSAAYRNLSDESFTIGSWLKTWWDIGEELPWEGTERFQKLCTLINASCYMPQWLRAHGLNVHVYRLEDVTSSVGILSEIVTGHTQKILRHWQFRDVNRKVVGDRRPATLWASWTPENQQMFTAMCKDTMLEFGYWRNGYDRTH